MSADPAVSEVGHAESALACGAERDPLGSGAACEAPPVQAIATRPDPPEATTLTSPIATAPAALACESHSCGGEVTCAGDGP
jgi:hypothetical protein